MFSHSERICDGWFDSAGYFISTGFCVGVVRLSWTKMVCIQFHGELDLECLGFIWSKSLRADGMCGQIAHISTHVCRHFSLISVVPITLS
jgi:hypothetical protein